MKKLLLTMMLLAVGTTFGLSPQWSVTVNNPGQMVTDGANGPTLWVLSGANLIGVSIATHTVTATVTPGTRGTPLSAIAWDGGFVAVGDYDGQVYRINDSTLQVFNVASIGFPVTSIAIDLYKREMWVGTDVSYDGNHYFLYIGSLAVPSMSWSHILSSLFGVSTMTWTSQPVSDPKVVAFGPYSNGTGPYQTSWDTNSYTLVETFLILGGAAVSIPAADPGLGAVWMADTDYLFQFLVPNYGPGGSSGMCPGPSECQYSQVYSLGGYLLMAEPVNNLLQIVNKSTLHYPPPVVTGLPTSVTYLAYSAGWNFVFAGSPAANTITALQ